MKPKLTSTLLFIWLGALSLLTNIQAVEPAEKTPLIIAHIRLVVDQIAHLPEQFTVDVYDNGQALINVPAYRKNAGRHIVTVPENYIRAFSSDTSSAQIAESAKKHHVNSSEEPVVLYETHPSYIVIHRYGLDAKEGNQLTTVIDYAPKQITRIQLESSEPLSLNDAANTLVNNWEWFKSAN